jgi:hypothetical protein
MKLKHRPLFAFIALLVFVSLACGALGGPSQPAPTEAPVQISTLPPATEQPAQPIAPPEQPTQPEAPVIVTEKFFTEEFDAPLSNAWSILTVTDSNSADPDKVTVETANGKLVWDFQSEYVYYYLFYEGDTYADVKLEVHADNRGRNNNFVSLICRYDPRVGWYEFNVENNGLYSILYAEITSAGDIRYNLVANGGSNAIKQGRDINEYSVSCIGDKLNLTINGREVTTTTERRYSLRDGGVGISVGSQNVLPIIVEMDWFKIIEP